MSLIFFFNITFLYEVGKGGSKKEGAVGNHIAFGVWVKVQGYVYGVQSIGYKCDTDEVGKGERQKEGGNLLSLR